MIPAEAVEAEIYACDIAANVHVGCAHTNIRPCVTTVPTHTLAEFKRMRAAAMDRADERIYPNAKSYRPTK